MQAETRERLLQIADQYIDDAEFRTTSSQKLNELRDQCPVMKTSSGVWLVTADQGLRDVLRDGGVFSRRTAGFKHTMLDPGPARDYFTAKMLWHDGADHARLRRLVTTVFTQRGIRKWEPDIEQIANALIDKVEPQGKMDMISDYSFALSQRMICRLLGVPYEDREIWQSCVHRILEPPAGADQTPFKDAAAAAILEFADYILGLIAKRRSATTEQDDILTRLLNAESSGDSELSETEVVALCLEFIGAGFESTGYFISTLVWLLLSHPVQWAELQADRTLLDGAIDECLRLGGPAIITLPRAATRDIEVLGTRIPAGDTVLCLHDPANRDPASFDEPETFDIHRSPNPHNAFGSGAHMCIGKSLAWAESRIALTALLDRLPGLRLGADAPTKWGSHRYLRGLATLPVVW
jgi:cytochrome P450